MDIMLNNTDITLQLNYKILQSNVNIAEKTVLLGRVMRAASSTLWKVRQNPVLHLAQQMLESVTKH